MVPIGKLSDYKDKLKRLNEKSIKEINKWEEEQETGFFKKRKDYKPKRDKAYKETRKAARRQKQREREW